MILLSRILRQEAVNLPSKVVLPELTSQRYARFDIYRGIWGKTFHVLRLCTQNPRGTLLRALPPFLKFSLASFLGIQYYETLYNWRRSAPY